MLTHITCQFICCLQKRHTLQVLHKQYSFNVYSLIKQCFIPEQSELLFTTIKKEKIISSNISPNKKKKMSRRICISNGAWSGLIFCLNEHFFVFPVSRLFCSSRKGESANACTATAPKAFNVAAARERNVPTSRRTLAAVNAKPFVHLLTRVHCRAC